MELGPAVRGRAGDGRPGDGVLRRRDRRGRGARLRGSRRGGRAGLTRRLEWLEILSAEHENLQAALRRAVESGEIALALRLLASLSSYLWMRGMRTSPTAQAVTLLDMIGDSPPQGLGDEYVLCALHAAAGETGREEWERHRRTAASIVVDPDRPHRHPVVTLLWPMVDAGAEDLRATLSVIARGEAGSDPWERAVVHLLWGYPQLGGGDLVRAEHEFTSAADAFRSLGDRWGTALALDALAGLAGLRGDYRVRAAQAGRTTPVAQIGQSPQAGRVTQAGQAAQATPTAPAPPTAPAASAGTDSADAGLSAARADYERAAEIARRAGSTTYLAAALRGLGDIARLEGDPAGARRLYEQALERFETHWVKSAGSRTGALFGLGRIAEDGGDLEKARRLHRQAVEVTVKTGATTESTRPFEALAGIALLEGDASAAAMLLGATVALRGVFVEDDPDVSRTAAAARAALGDERYEALHRRGARLSRTDALRLAGISESVIRSSPINAVAGHGLSRNRAR
ncbi:tetratricopeptide repeat protein [Streptosporangium sp. NPDC004631]